MENKLTASELRIGNKILRDNVIWDIFQIERRYKNVYRINDININFDNQIELSQMCSPIPLTEEWHNKFGIKQNGVGVFEYKISELKIIIFSSDYVYLLDISNLDGKRSIDDNICTLWNKDIKRRHMYVHEWQNLYFALTNEELIIK